MRKTYSVPGIHCGSCAAVIEEGLSEIPGLSSVDVDIAAKTVTVGYTENDAAERVVLQRLEEEGYPVSHL